MSSDIVTKINSDIIISEPAGGIRFGTDALLLADFALSAVRRGKGVDLGTGSGVIPLLMLAAGSKASFLGLELQKEYADAATKNSSVNGFSDRFKVICGNVDDIRNFIPAGSADFVVANPPYMRVDCGKDNENRRLSIARREVAGGAASFCRAAAWCLKSGGRFFAVYRPDRIVNLICEMRANGIEPKRLRAVIPSVGKKPSLLLAEGIKDAAEGLTFCEDLYIYSDAEHKNYSAEMSGIYAEFSSGKG